jgi:hypothetical protein
MNDLWSHNTERRIYVDCDGVLADFDTHFEDHIGLKSSHYESTHAEWFPRTAWSRGLPRNESS